MDATAREDEWELDEYEPGDICNYGKYIFVFSSTPETLHNARLAKC